MSAENPKKNEAEAPKAAEEPKKEQTLEALRKTNLELLSGIGVLQLRKTNSDPEKLQALRVRESELKTRCEELTSLYEALLRSQDLQLAPESIAASDPILKSIAVKFLSEQKVPEELWKSLVS